MRECVANLEVSHAEERAVGDEDVGRNPVFGVAPYVFGIFVGSAFASPTILHICGEVLEVDVVALCSVENVVADSAVELERDVEAVSVSTEIEAVGPVGRTLADLGLVVVGDRAVAIDIHKNHVAGSCAGLNHLALSIGVGADLVVVLEDAVGLVAVEERVRIAVFSTCDCASALLRIEVCIAGFVAVVDEFVFEVGGVGINLEIPFASLPAVCSVKLPTLVVHNADVAGGTILAYIGVDWHLHQHTICALLVPIDGESESILQETEVCADVGLFGFLPAKERVGEYARFCTVDDPFFCARAEDVIVARSGERSVAELTDGLVAVFTPGEAEFCKFEPCGTVCEERFFGYIPSDRE